MFVPTMKDWQASELGHRNYQHPSRSAEHFAPELDTFSAWAIYASIQATILNPEVFRELGGGDDCLLFHRHDFDHPSESRALQLLSQLPHPGPQLAQSLTKMINSSVLEYTPLPPSTFTRPVRMFGDQGLRKLSVSFLEGLPRAERKGSLERKVLTATASKAQETHALNERFVEDTVKQQPGHGFMCPCVEHAKTLTKTRTVTTFARVVNKKKRTRRDRAGKDFIVEFEYVLRQGHRDRMVRKSITVSPSQ